MAGASGASLRAANLGGTRPNRRRILMHCICALRIDCYHGVILGRACCCRQCVSTRILVSIHAISSSSCCRRRRHFVDRHVGLLAKGEAADVSLRTAGAPLAQISFPEILPCFPGSPPPTFTLPILQVASVANAFRRTFYGSTDAASSFFGALTVRTGMR